MTLPSRNQNLEAELLTAIIVDDESVARARLRRLLSADGGVTILAECDNGKDAVTAIVERKPDVVFLDIQMPEFSGFEVLEALSGRQLPAFVFVTAFDSFAVAAFAADALDYLLKPFDAERLQVTLKRARERLKAGASQDDLLSAVQKVSDGQQQIQAALAMLPRGRTSDVNYLERIAVKTDGRVIFVRVDDLDYVEAAANYVRLRAGAESHTIREPLGELATKLDPRRFARIHRGTIVNLEKIKEIQPWFSGDAIIILRNGQKLRLSRYFRSSMDTAMRNRL